MGHCQQAPTSGLHRFYQDVLDDMERTVNDSHDQQAATWGRDFQAMPDAGRNPWKARARSLPRVGYAASADDGGCRGEPDRVPALGNRLHVDLDTRASPLPRRVGPAHSLPLAPLSCLRSAIFRKKIPGAQMPLAVLAVHDLSCFLASV